jgi:hypothetical protein
MPTDDPTWTTSDLTLISADNIRFRVPQHLIMTGRWEEQFCRCTDTKRCALRYAPRLQTQENGHSLL